MRPSTVLPIVTVAAVLAFVVPLAAAQLGGLGQPSASTPQAPSVQTPSLPTGNFLPELSLGQAVLVSLALTVVIVIASIFFLGGAKFVNSENVLENEARRVIFEYINTNPGTHLRATAAALAFSTTNVLWHMRKLEDANLISSKKLEGYKVFYPVAGGVESKKRAIALSVLKNDNAQDILSYILGNPSAHQREIARALGVNHGTIRWHLRKLTEAGLVLQVKKEHTSQYYVSELGVQILAERTGAKASPRVPAAVVAPGAVHALPASATVAPALAGLADQTMLEDGGDGGDE